MASKYSLVKQSETDSAYCLVIQHVSTVIKHPSWATYISYWIKTLELHTVHLNSDYLPKWTRISNYEMCLICVKGERNFLPCQQCFLWISTTWRNWAKVQNANFWDNIYNLGWQFLISQFYLITIFGKQSPISLVAPNTFVFFLVVFSLIIHHGLKELVAGHRTTSEK